MQNCNYKISFENLYRLNTKIREPIEKYIKNPSGNYSLLKNKETMIHIIRKQEEKRRRTRSLQNPSISNNHKVLPIIQPAPHSSVNIKFYPLDYSSCYLHKDKINSYYRKYINIHNNIYLSFNDIYGVFNILQAIYINDSNNMVDITSDYDAKIMILTLLTLKFVFLKNYTYSEFCESFSDEFFNAVGKHDIINKIYHIDDKNISITKNTYYQVRDDILVIFKLLAITNQSNLTLKTYENEEDYETYKIYNTKLIHEELIKVPSDNHEFIKTRNEIKQY